MPGAVTITSVAWLADDDGTVHKQPEVFKAKAGPCQIGGWIIWNFLRSASIDFAIKFSSLHALYPPVRTMITLFRP